MNEIQIEKIKEFNERISKGEIYLSIARDSGLQKNACEELTILLTDVGLEKQIAIETADENFANLLLGFECGINSIISEIRMWISLKEENPDQAWDELISAQNAAISAARAHSAFGKFSHIYKRLEAIEELIFPAQVFMSSGMIVKMQECSICGNEYGECDHLAGKPYMGKFCSIIATNFEINHVAIVQDPADKRCRVVNFETEGGVRNRMTWVITPKQIENLEEE
jgi:hypothetical protein